MADARSLTFTIAGDSRKLQTSLDQASTAINKTNKSLEKTHTAAKTAAVGFAALAAGRVAVDFLKDATKAAAADETAMSRAGVAVKNAGENWKKLKPEVSETLTKMSETSGFMKHDLSEAFSKLELATHNHTKALVLEKDAMNIAAQTGKPLQAIALALGKTYDGNAGALKRLGIIVPKVTTEQDKLVAAHTRAVAAGTKFTAAQKIAYKESLDAAKAADRQASATSALDAAHKKFAGGVEARSQTMAGKIAIFQAKWEEIKVRIGDVILPLVISALGKLITTFDSLTTFVQDNKTVVEILGVAVGALTGLFVLHEVAIKAAEIATKAWNVVTGLATAAQWLWNAAMDANPIGLLVLAITGLIAAGVLLYKHSETARTIINGAWNDIKTTVKPIIDFFTDTALPAFGAAFDAVQTVVGTAIDAIKGSVKLGLDPVLGAIKVIKDLLNGDFSQAWSDIKTTVGKVFGDIDQALGGLPGKLAKAALNVLGDAADLGGNIVTGILKGLGGLYDALVSAVGSAVSDALSTVTGGLISGGNGKGNGSVGKSGGHFKAMASGGIVTRPTFALIGEAGPEAVIPLGRGSRGMGGNTFHIYTQGIDEQSLAAKMAFQARVAGAAL